MLDNDQYWIELLKHNKGFEPPEKWVDYAKNNDFKKVKSLGAIFPAACGVDQVNYPSDTPLLAAGSFIG